VGWKSHYNEIIVLAANNVFGHYYIITLLCSLLWVTLLRQGGWTGWSTEVPSDCYHSVILDFMLWSAEMLSWQGTVEVSVWDRYESCQCSCDCL